MYHAGPLAHVCSRINDHAWHIPESLKQKHVVSRSIETIRGHARDIVAKPMQELFQVTSHENEYITILKERTLD